MSERLIAAVDALEAVICERYNVRSLTGVGPFAEALAQARVGNVEPIDAALAGREMYRWRETVEGLLENVHVAADEPEEAPKAKGKKKAEQPVDEPEPVVEEASPVEPTTLKEEA